MTTKYKQIEALEKAIARLEHTESSYIGGAKAYHSGAKVEMTKTAKAKWDKLNAQLDAILDTCEA